MLSPLLWHQVSWSHVNLPSKFFLPDYIYTAVVTWQCQWQWKCVGRQCNTLISRSVIVWSPCLGLSYLELPNPTVLGLVNCLHVSVVVIWLCTVHTHTFGLIIDIFVHMQPTQVQTQTLITAEHRYVAKPNNFMTLSAFALLCCMCWPAFIFAIVAMIYSTQVLALYCNVIL